jgi:sec-independent protein translocase protein TatB
MFGFSWAEIGLIMAVALIAIGPKDLPVAIRTVTKMMKKARGMAAEFQGHVDEMMREANLADVKTEIGKLRRFDFKTEAEKFVDPDGAFIPPEAARKAAVPAFIPPGTRRWGY